ncbi:huntingtin-interacting protein 1 isoform X2 [Bombyx mori]|uniref:Huntingtin-interacting protein 1 n=1 Tax=Bombyx mori TaxID=7091 RepID=A0A8R2QUG1_BOMMO|nr:huntingtin-interacting protein 1 isoform X2 [Bombyx mori]XP_037868331.1 huntingtin-interacting protein 1 isoform X2 [Bombyx mori]XP_037868332.1 huntingtin-interacting protein 1 isoform X2 [Bombyx mori]
MANPNDKRFFQLTLAIQKAINTNETPVKEKHVRSTIIGTFREQSAITYWMVAVRLPIQDNRIVAWKFCHVTHKLLREGHPACLDDSQRHISMIENLGKLWVHLREGYGKLVHLYCNLLVCKLKFHARNPRFPGNMQLTADELDAIAENDVNNYFQLCVELFDYMDEILNLQAAVFDSLGNARANSMTASGQCRLAALIPCAQDASQLYDCNVRLLFRLHAALPADTLLGHRERFRQQFKKLSTFYKHASSLQYYRNLLTLPVLPSNPPNFLLQSEFGTYVTPVVSVPEPPPDEPDAVGALVDTSDALSQSTSDQFEEFESRPSASPQPDPVVERDRLIDHLQNELKRMRTEVSQLVQERNSMLGSMREHCIRLETQLQTAKAELEDEKQRAVALSAETPEIKQKLVQTEEMAKTIDEKFQKLKGAYTQLREEHIVLIRKKAEVDKMAANLRATAAQHETAKMSLQQQLNDRMKDVELLQQSASSSEEIEVYKSEIANLRSELEQSREKENEFQILKASMEALEIEHKTVKTEQEDKILTISNELKESKEILEKVMQEKIDKDTELIRVKEELLGLREKSGDEYKKVVEEKEEALKKIIELSETHAKEKEELIFSNAEFVNQLQMDLDKLKQNLADVESNYSLKFEILNEEMVKKNSEFEKILNEKDCDLKEALQKLEAIENDYETVKKIYKEQEQEKQEQINKLSLEIENCKRNNEIVQEVNNEKLELANRISDLECLGEKNNNKIGELNEIIQEQKELVEREKQQNESLSIRIKELESEREEHSKNIDELNEQLKDALSRSEKLKFDYEDQLKSTNYNVTLLNDKLQNVTGCKDDLIDSLKSMITEKDKQVINLNCEVTKLTENVTRLTEELTETHAELEIGKNEFFTLREEFENIMDRNEKDLALKDQELANLRDEINKITKKTDKLEKEKVDLLSELDLERQTFENKIKELHLDNQRLQADYEAIESEKQKLSHELTSQIEKINSDYEMLMNTNTNDKVEYTERISDLQLSNSSKDEIINTCKVDIENLKAEIEELKQNNLKEKDDIEAVLTERNKQKQLSEARIEHVEHMRLNAECELQDLLQNNSVLEADVAALKRQLDEAQRELEKQRLEAVTCVGEAALALTNEALAALERSDAQESTLLASQLAVEAFEQLDKCSEIKGNEEAVMKSAINVAHNTAQLVGYVTEASHVSTSLELTDKLQNECRAMLSSTRECLEAVRGGRAAGTRCGEARARVLGAAHAAAAALRPDGAARTVDDELDDMDAAIEHAASQIEEMLAASRAGDSGVKLEVNGKILDACTTLMAAVKVLVQDARQLQNELGDQHSRQKMYRKNPQWSEGLISAAKAVVFAAKLLVSSADEAVGGSGRMEGVSAAAHEVAGSTAQLVAASRARAPPQTPALTRLTQASRGVAAATGALVGAVRAASARLNEQEALDTSALTLTATRILEMESKVRSLELESALDAERARLAALRKRHYLLAQQEENGSITNGKE